MSTSVPMKVTELIKQSDFTFSFEVSPSFIERIDNLEIEPAFYALTWISKSHKCKDLNIEPLKLARILRNKHKQVLLHMSCDLMRKQYLEQVLTFLQEIGVCNLLLLLGERYDASASDFASTSELLKYIRQISGQYFCIGVTGYCDSDEDGYGHLKRKVDSGADFIVTQAFFDHDIYKKFIQKCQEIGVNVPIIPGLYPFENYSQLIHFTKLCKINVAEDLLSQIQENEDQKVASVAMQSKLIQSIRQDMPSTHFHFFFLNSIQSVTDVIKEIQK